MKKIAKISENVYAIEEKCMTKIVVWRCGPREERPRAPRVAGQTASGNKIAKNLCHFRQNDENDEKIVGENGKNIIVIYALKTELAIMARIFHQFRQETE